MVSRTEGSNHAYRECVVDGVRPEKPYFTGFSGVSCLTEGSSWGTFKSAPGPQSESLRIPSGPRR
jgi:hypothetical protein